MEKKRLLVVGNEVAQDWDFRQGVEAFTGKPWDITVGVINRFDGLHKYTRYLTYLLKPLKLFFVRNKYEKIITSYCGFDEPLAVAGRKSRTIGINKVGAFFITVTAVESDKVAVDLAAQLSYTVHSDNSQRSDHLVVAKDILLLS